jgi:ABC-type proline/glycine betaine transport system permease subunit
LYSSPNIFRFGQYMLQVSRHSFLLFINTFDSIFFSNYFCASLTFCNSITSFLLQFANIFILLPSFFLLLFLDLLASSTYSHFLPSLSH